MSHTSNNCEDETTSCTCPVQDSIQFLDTSCTISAGKIILDLYKKPTDRNMYLLPSSCHPPHQHENVPISLAMRINRICTFSETREKRFQELAGMLKDRGYRHGMVQAAIDKARKIPRNIALRKVVKSVNTKRPVAVVSWDPRLPPIDTIQQKHWRGMTSLDPYLKQVFPEPPLLAYKRQKNIRDYLIRAKLPPKQTRPIRHIKGMTKCKRNCVICPYILEGREISGGEFKWVINSHVSCNSYNICYMLLCMKDNCKMKNKIQQRYIGETERTLKDRICEHLGYINTKKLNEPAGEHFNKPGHSKADMKVLILEKVKSSDPQYRKERESYLIRKFNSYYKGLNKKP